MDGDYEKCENDVEYDKIWEAFNEMRQKNLWCDADLISGDGCIFHVHKAILAANSKHFLKNFTTKGSTLYDNREIMTQSVDSEQLETIVEYMYKRKARINMDNAWAILQRAEDYEIRGLVEQCCIFLCTALNYYNSVQIYMFSTLHNKHELMLESRRFILRNYITICQKSPDFVHLSHQDITSFISDDNLNIKTEESIYESVVKWIDYNPPKRTKYLATFLTKIKLGLISTEYFVDNISSHPYVIMEQQTCEPLIRSAWEFVYNIQKNGVENVSLSHPLVKPRVPKDVVFTVGGWSGDYSVAQFETYDTRADRWYTHNYLEENTARSYYGMAVVDNIIYVIGGFDGFMLFNSNKKFDPLSKVWTDLSPMYSQRSYVAVAACKGYIYAIGGKEGKDAILRLNTVERYDPKTNQWLMVEHMICKRSDAGADTIGGKIYVVGGFNGEEHLSSVEFYTPEIDQWTMSYSMSLPRSGISVVAYDDMLYVIGGHDGIERLASGEKFDPLTKMWSPIKSMYTARSNCASAIIDDMIFIMGGFDGVTTISNVECYDPSTNEWLDATFMNMSRSGFKACVINDLPIAKHYTFYGCHDSYEHQVVLEDVVF